MPDSWEKHFRDIESEIGGFDPTHFLAEEKPLHPAEEHPSDDKLSPEQEEERRLKMLQLSLAERTRVFMVEQLKAGAIDPQMTAAELPAYLKDKIDKERSELGLSEAEWDS